MGSLYKWFKSSKSVDGKPGWVNVVTGGTCASDEPGEGTPKCVSSTKRASMTDVERKSAARRKKSADPEQQSKSDAAKPTYVSTDKPEKKMNEENDIKGKGSGKKDACYNKVKSKYDVWPSAYASGALVKCRKVGAANWGNKTEETMVDEGKKCWTGYKKKGTKKMFGKTYNNCVKETIEEMSDIMRYCPKCQKDETRSECKYGVKYWDMFSLPSSLTPNQLKYDIAQVHPANEEKQPDHEHSMARSELSTIVSAAKRLRKKLKGEGNIEAWVQSKITKAADYIDAAADYVESGEHDVEESCWSGYKRKPKTKKFSPGSCVKETYSNWREELQLNPTTFEFVDLIKPDPLQPTRGIGSDLVSEDWQKVNRKDKTDGLSQAAVNAYRKENPGSKLQTAVTEKKPKGKRAKRRANFCSRMSGMKDKLTSAKTARDPDSRINKALRRWNCN